MPKRKALKGRCEFYSETGTEGGYWAFRDSRYIIPPDGWSYEGLYILESGDKLTIFSPDNPEEIVWSGIISLRKHPVFSESVFSLWIHSDQEGVDRETWATYFLKEYPAEFIPARRKKTE